MLPSEDPLADPLLALPPTRSALTVRWRVRAALALARVWRACDQAVSSARASLTAATGAAKSADFLSKRRHLSERGAGLLAIGLVLVIGLVGLALAPAQPRPGAATATNPPALGNEPAVSLLRRFSVPGAGFSIDLPASWQTYGTATPASGSTVLTAEGTTVSMNVVWRAAVIPSGTTVEALRSALISEVGALDGVIDPSVTVAALPAGPAVRASYRFGGGAPHYPGRSIVQYLVAGPNGDSYLLTFVSLSPAALDSAFGIAGSLSLTGTVH